MMKKPINKLVLSALFMALGLVLPFFTGQIQSIGNLLLPMHIPVFLCAFICGWQYGATMGFILPILRSVTFGMPMLYPNAVSMAVELAVYGLVAGIIYNKIKISRMRAIYLSMLIAMVAGRAMWGVAQMCLLGLKHNAFTWNMFIAGAFANALPGIILQLILVPQIVLRVEGKRTEYNNGDAR